MVNGSYYRMVTFKKNWKQGTMSFGVILVKAPIELKCLLLDRFGFFFGVPFR